MNPERFSRLKAVLDRRQPDLTVLMEQVNKTHNFSAVLRNCDAVGVLRAHAVMPEKNLELHHHTSAGTTRWVEVDVHQTVMDAVSTLHEQGFKVLAAHPEGDALDYREIDLTLPVAFMVGAELDGLTTEGLALADARVAIPMVGMVRSLNVSVATSLLLFEAFRQREAAGLYQASRLPPPIRNRLLFEWAYPEIAAVLKRQGRDYPGLDEGGDFLDPI